MWSEAKIRGGGDVSLEVFDMGGISGVGESRFENWFIFQKLG